MYFSFKIFFLKWDYTQFSFPSLCVLLLGNIKMTEAGVGETVCNDKLRIFYVGLKLWIKKLTVI